MRRLLPRSLSGQTLAVLIIGLAVSHAIGIALYSLDREEAVISAEGIDFADRVVGVVSLLRKLPAQWRDDVVQGSDGRKFHVALGNTADADRWDKGNDLARTIGHYLLDEMPGWPADGIVVGYLAYDDRQLAKPAETAVIERLLGATDRNSPHDFLTVSLRLSDSVWLNFAGAIPKPARSGLLWAGVYILSVAVGVGAVSMWLVWRVSAPLTSFARAADQLGRNLRAEPLSETGPAEVAQASKAFNAMQGRLRRMVENRTQMLAAVSHDLRTPITLLRLRAELIDETENRTRILAALDEMETMVASVLDFTKATFHDEPQRQVDLTALVESICDDRADAGADVSFTAPDKILHICRRMELKRAIANLIDNALKYGSVARVAMERTQDGISLTIDDNGPGIREEEIETVFMPFYRIDSSRGQGGGTGLGLSIAQSIIDGHGGKLTLENRAEGGLRARVSLPA